MWDIIDVSRLMRRDRQLQLTDLCMLSRIHLLEKLIHRTLQSLLMWLDAVDQGFGVSWDRSVLCLSSLLKSLPMWCRLHLASKLGNLYVHLLGRVDVMPLMKQPMHVVFAAGIIIGLLAFKRNTAEQAAAVSCSGFLHCPTNQSW